MEIRRILQSFLLCFALVNCTPLTVAAQAPPPAPSPAPAVPAAPALPVAPGAPAIAFDGTPAPGKTVAVKGDKDASLAVYSASDATNCNMEGFPNLGDPVQISTAGSDPAAIVKLTGASQTVALSTLAKVGDTLCLRASKQGALNFASKAVVNPVVIKIDFAEKPVAGSSTIKVQSDDKAVVSVYLFPAAYTPTSKSPNCTSDDIPPGHVLAIGSVAPTANTIAVNGSAPFTITLNKPVQAGTQLCLYATEKDTSGNVSVYYSPFTAAQDAPAVAQTPAPDFKGTPASGDSSIVITGVSGATVSIYQFDNTVDEANPSKLNPTCPDLMKEHAGKPLPLSASGTNSTSALSQKLTDPAPYSISLVNPLLPGKYLCIEETGAASASGVTPDPVYSGFLAVTDTNNPYPRVRTFYTAGAMVNNQAGGNTSGSSSTGAEYVNIGMSFTGLPESNKSHIGISNSITGLFSSVSVAAPVTPAAQSGGQTPATNNGTLNILSSQESFRMLGNMAFPIRVGHNEPGYSFFGAPMVRVGLTTLLNPSASAATGSNGAITSTAATFAPVYWEGTAGVRIGYRKYPAAEGTPTTKAQVDLMFGKFSNLQSFLCAPESTTTDLFSTTKPTNTSCFTPGSQTTTAATTQGYYLQNQLRSIQKRFDLSGYFLFPDTPFVLGFDANIPQSALAPRNLDILNKASGNVTIYFGVTGNLSTLFKNLKLAGAPQ